MEGWGDFQVSQTCTTHHHLQSPFAFFSRMILKQARPISVYSLHTTATVVSVFLTIMNTFVRNSLFCQQIIPMGFCRMKIVVQIFFPLYRDPSIFFCFVFSYFLSKFLLLFSPIILFLAHESNHQSCSKLSNGLATIMEENPKSFSWLTGSCMMYLSLTPHPQLHTPLCFLFTAFRPHRLNFGT